MPASFGLSVRDVGEVHVVSIRGELDLATVPGLADRLVEASGSTVVVDLNELEFIDSTGIGEIVHARNRILELGDFLVLSRPRPNVRRLFEVTGLDDWISEWDPSWG